MFFSVLTSLGRVSLTLLWNLPCYILGYLLVNLCLLTRIAFQEKYSPLTWTWELQSYRDWAYRTKEWVGGLLIRAGIKTKPDRPEKEADDDADALRQPEQPDFRGKTVVITGVTCNFGHRLTIEIAKEVLDSGGCLVLTGRDQRCLDAVREACLELSTNAHPRIKTVILDLMNITPDAIETLKRAGHHIDYFFHNAGLRCKKPILQSTAEEDQKVLATNLEGHIFLTKQLLPKFLEDKTHLIVTGSLSAVLPSPLRTTYTASKGGLHGFYSALRKESPSLKTTMLHLGPITDENRSKMVRLCLEAIMEKLPEVWIADRPYLLFAYLTQYFPWAAGTIDRLLGISSKMVDQWNEANQH